MRPVMRILLPIAATVMLGGCVYGPDYGYVRGDGYYGDAYYGTSYSSGQGYYGYDPGYFYGYGPGYYYGPSIGFYYGHGYRRGPWRGRYGGWNGGDYSSGGHSGHRGGMNPGSHVRSGAPASSHSGPSHRH